MCDNTLVLIDNEGLEEEEDNEGLDDDEDDAEEEGYKMVVVVVSWVVTSMTSLYPVS